MIINRRVFLASLLALPAIATAQQGRTPPSDKLMSGISDLILVAEDETKLSAVSVLCALRGALWREEDIELADLVNGWVKKKMDEDGGHR